MSTCQNNLSIVNAEGRVRNPLKEEFLRHLSQTLFSQFYSPNKERINIFPIGFGCTLEQFMVKMYWVLWKGCKDLNMPEMQSIIGGLRSCCLSSAQRTGEFRAAWAVNTLCHPSRGSSNNMKALVGGFGTFSWNLVGVEPTKPEE